MTVDRKAWRFFVDHAGYATPPGRAVCAAELVRSEAWANFERDNGRLTVEWVDDNDADLSWADESTLADIDAGTYAVLGCVVTYHAPLAWSGATTERFESLWGIVVTGPNDPYCRVVAAELCAQVRP
jgi:hypothetical protein